MKTVTPIMKTPRILQKLFAIVPGVALLPILAVARLVSCKRQGGEAKPADVDYYTCTMHPSVRSQKLNDKCPICSMNLVPVMKKNKDASTEPAMGEKGHDHAKMLAEQAGRQ